MLLDPDYRRDRIHRWQVRAARLSVVLALASIVLTICSTVTPAAAEWAFDVYGGGAFAERTDIKTISRLAPILGFNFRTTAEDVRFDTTAAIGGRLGYWTERLSWLGFGVDVMHFRREVPIQSVTISQGAFVSGDTDINGPDFSTVAVSFFPMLRWPLMTDASHPKGLVQPYIFGGPTLFFTELSQAPLNASRAHARTLGVTAGGGVSVPISHWLALFGEYRFTRERASFDSRSDIILGTTPMPITVTTETTFQTHMLLVGASLRW